MKIIKLFKKVVSTDKKSNNWQKKSSMIERRSVTSTQDKNNFEQHIYPVSTIVPTNAPKQQEKETGVESKLPTFGKIIPEYKFYKPIVKKKLTVLLIENTKQMAEHKEVLSRIFRSLQLNDLVCVINYGSTVHKGKILESSEWNNSDFLCEDDLGEKSCLYDALVELEAFVSTQYFKTTEKDKERVQINSVEVIGIGTCKDNGSKTTKDTAIERFYWLSNKSYVSTKYFCLTENNFLDTAEMGFRSIGAIIRN